MGIHDWFEWANAGVGLAGLGLTLWAIRQATGAKRAAQRAEECVLRRNAAVDFGSLARMAKELHGYVEAGRMAEARLRTTDLRSELALAISNHKMFLGPQLYAVKDRQVDLVLVADGLNRGAELLTRSEKVRLLAITGAILEELAGQCGELRSNAERGVTHG